MSSKCLFPVSEGSLGLALTSKNFKNGILWVSSVAGKMVPSQRRWRIMLRRISPQNLCFSLCSESWRGRLGHLACLQADWKVDLRGVEFVVTSSPDSLSTGPPDVSAPPAPAQACWVGNQKVRAARRGRPRSPLLPQTHHKQ